MGLVEIDPNVGWYCGRSESGWNVYEVEGHELKVTFGSERSLVRRWAACRLLVVRSGTPADDDIILSGPDLENVELGCEVWGEPLDEQVDDDKDQDDQDDES
ncbi:hypothetical protein MMC28_008881 [Mycoblastus sanguinarius]|nr:hypothetical protein [Mycoblastus sanguinarius]